MSGDWRNREGEKSGDERVCVGKRNGDEGDESGDSGVGGGGLDGCGGSWEGLE